MATCIRKVRAEVLGVTKGSGCDLKDAWWWNEEVQKAIKEKNECYKHLYQDRCADNIEKYKVAKKTAKQAVGEVKGRAYKGLYQRLNTKEGEKDIYRMARAHDRKTRDFNQVKCIKDEREQLLVKEDEIKHRCQEYFDKLFNGENENSTVWSDDSFDDTNRRFVRRIQEQEVREALKRMKVGKVMGYDGIPIKVWRCLEDLGADAANPLVKHVKRFPGKAQFV
ncbi:uncharacterized protein [Miscanthus floridulus]|uniref:uncharacterized protein n=1 Tax=Miscanthus floridulus TaxID=154761 RepID=UPI0034588688